MRGRVVLPPTNAPFAEAPAPGRRPRAGARHNGGSNEEPDRAGRASVSCLCFLPNQACS